MSGRIFLEVSHVALNGIFSTGSKRKRQGWILFQALRDLSVSLTKLPTRQRRKVWEEEEEGRRVSELQQSSTKIMTFLPF